MRIHQIPGYIQTIYLVEYNHGLILLDGCCRCDVNLVVNYIESNLKRPLNDLKLVVSTHAHPDHAGGLSEFKKLGIRIAGPAGLNDWYGGVSGFATYWVDILLTYLVAVNKKKPLRNIIFPRKTKLDLILREGDTLDGFSDWKVLECPGHTLSDITLYHQEQNLAYIADNFVGNNKRVFRPYPIIAPEKYQKSLKRYLDLGIERFLLAHHGEVQIPKKRILELIDSTPETSRRHMNTLPAIFTKLLRAFIRKKKNN